MTVKINTDVEIDIAVGRSRKETNWKNEKWLWSKLVERVGNTHRTAETHAEYMAAKKSRQDEIKDIGGYVGGTLINGRRKASNVFERSFLSLDVDYGTPDYWFDLTLSFSNAAVIYSTHKHSANAYRLRMLMPFNRPVRPDEYEAIARYVAGILGIELFDPTTFQPERLMYWPSTSKDAEYIFKYQDGPLLDADAILATYRDWRDSSAWPVSAKVDKLLQRSMQKQGDPLDKPGVIGAFCRTYSIPEVIEKYLSDVYDTTDTENRYTFKEGSTAAGLIVYDNKFAYSHHGTDPSSGKLCNAFDLVRIHKFGLKDEDVREGTPGNKLPSFKDMEAFAANDNDVKVLLATERFTEAKGEFANLDEAEEIDLSWTKDLKVDKWGTPLSTIDNIYLVLKHDIELQGAFYYDEFDASIRIAKPLPWRKVSDRSKDYTDSDADCLSHYLEKRYKMPFTHLQKALSKILIEHTKHPVREYLTAQTWDKIERLERLFIDYLGAEDCKYIRAVTRKTFIAAVARIFEPGIKFDTVTTIIGKQGTGKSTIIAKLGKQWFSDCLGDIQKKEGMESVRGAWLIEIAEMASLRRAEQEAIKRFITSQEDFYRPSYGRHNVRFPRQCIFIGTTNKTDFLSDPTGNRRFLPVNTLVTKPTKNIFTDLTDTEINQLWAEAVTYYRQGESIDLSEEIKEMAEKIREQHTIRDDKTGIIERYLETLFPGNWSELNVYSRRSFLQGEDSLQPIGIVQKTVVCAAEIWCEALGCLQKDMNSQNTKYIHNIMQNMKGWQQTKGIRDYGIYGRQRGYERCKTGVSSEKSVFTQTANKVNAVNTM